MEQLKIQEVLAASPDEKAYLRERAKQDLYFLTTAVLGYQKMGRIHMALCKWIEEINAIYLKRFELRNELPKLFTERLWLLPRGHFKTTLLTVCHSVQLILLDPNIRLFIVTCREDSSYKLMRLIKTHFMDNKVFRALFPEYCPEARKDGKIEFGTATNFVTPARTNINLGEPTVCVTSVGCDWTGAHHDYQKLDDVVTAKKSGEEMNEEKVVEWFRYARSLFDNAQIVFRDIVGTPYTQTDLYARLKAQENCVPVDFEELLEKIA